MPTSKKERKFKVGDEVIVINSDFNDLPIGAIFTVIDRWDNYKENNEGVVIKINAYKRKFFDWRFDYSPNHKFKQKLEAILDE